MFGTYTREIKIATECAVVAVLVDNKTPIRVGICRYVQSDAADDPDCESADSFEKIAKNRAYGLFGSGHDFTVTEVKPVSRDELEKLTGVDWYKFGSEALEQDQWTKVIRKGSDPTMKAIADYEDQEFEDDEY